jgi:arylsulfatase
MLILIDAMRPDHLGCYGYDKDTSPHMDALAARGTRFARVYANAPWTRSSTTCFLTGLNASRHRTQTCKSKVPADVVTLAQRLRKAGWATSGFSANGNGGSMADLDRGFQVFEDPTNTYVRKGLKERCRERFGESIEPEEHKDAVLADCVRYNRLPTGEFLVHRVLEHLKKSKAKKEFLFVFLVDPHDPYGAPPELERRFLGKNFKGKIRRRAAWEYNNNYPEKERRSMQAIYDAAILYADQAMGQLIAGLDELGLSPNATLFVSADHGEGFGEHDFYLHAYHFWEEVVRIPLIAVGPRFGKKVDERLAQSLDLAATILDLAGLKADDLPGSSLLKPPPQGRRIISEYNEFGVHRQAILDGRWKVIWQRPADEEWFMRTVTDKKYLPTVSFDREVVKAYDLKNDPREKKTITDLPEPARALLQELRAFVEAAPEQPADTGPPSK